MNKKTRGAISVFLVMILVPCIVVTSVFVDLGRVHMSKVMANSASDLALNSLLSNYDADLEEWYGMVASCQSIEEFYDVSAQFFLRTLSSQGLSDDEIVLLSDYYAHATNNDQIYDLLQVECQTAPSDMIGEVSGANLTNSTMLKDQIVEFMKYRGPIEITLGLIDRLKSDSSTMNAIESEENKELVDDKSDYYKAEGELLAAAFNSYVAIYDYYKEASTNGLTNDKLKGYATRFSNYKSVYANINKRMISNLYNTSGLTAYARTKFRLDKYKTTYTKSHTEVYSRRNGDQYIIDGERITSLLDTLKTEIDDFNTAKTNFVNASSALMAKLPGSSATDSNAIQWWVQMNTAVNASSGTNYTTQLSTASDDMLKAYAKVIAIKDCALGNDIPTDWETRFDELTAEVVSLHRKYIITNDEITELANEGTTVTIDYTDSYNKTVKKLEEVSSANINNIVPSNLYVTVNGESKNLNDALAYIKSDLSSTRTELQGYVDLLNIAIDGNESDDSIAENDKVKSLDKLLELAGEYHTSLNIWSNTANSTDTSMGADNRQEIADIEQVCEEITEDSVRVLKTRLTNIRSQISSVITAIDELKYGGVKLDSIASFTDFKNAAQSTVSSSEIKLTNQELSNYASSVFASLFRPSTDFSLAHSDDNNYNPTISPTSGQIDTPELFMYFQSKFGGLSKQDVNEKKDELDGGEQAGSNKENETKEKGRYHGGGEDITKDFSGSGTFNIADGTISGVIDLFESLINLDITSIRDDLYVAAYIMNMLSYATFENEGLYSLIEDKTDLSLSNYSSKYQSVMGTGEDQEGTWLSINLKDSYNKSLTNKMINKNNNTAYCAEVEYVLYGGRDGKGNDDNVKSVYNNIYGIRYALNLVSGYANFWSGSDSTSLAIAGIAYGIWIATGGIIPEALTKVVLIPILTIFETSTDLDRLEAGFPVELYKSSHDQWWMSVPDLDSVASFTSELSNGGGSLSKKNQDTGLFYSDYLTVFVYLGLKSSCAESMYQRLSEVIQANMRKLTGVDTYSMAKARLYFKLNATIRVKPLMITIPYFNGYDNNMDTKTDWCTYKISTVRGYS